MLPTPLDRDFIRQLQPLLHQAAEGHRKALTDIGADPANADSSRSIYVSHIEQIRVAILRVLNDQDAIAADAKRMNEPALDRQVRELFEGIRA